LPIQDIFEAIEEEGLELKKPMHLLGLQYEGYMFMSRMNAELDQFREGWNHHRMRTTKRSPYQLLVDLRNIYQEPVPLEGAAQLEGGEGLEQQPYVQVVSAHCPMNKAQLAYFKAHRLNSLRK
jgi:hypothetical protein